MPQPARPTDLTAIPTISVRERQSLLNIEELATAPEATAPALDFLSTLSKVGLSKVLLEIARETREAAGRKHMVLGLIGDAVIASGYSTILTSLMEHAVFSALAMTGRAALYDFEIAAYGHTNEDPAFASYGSSRESGELFNQLVNDGVGRGFGLGEFLGRSLLDRRHRHIDYSILAHGSATRIPLTIHPLIGADPVHRHVAASGMNLGKGAHRDFLLLAGQLPALDDGGIVLDFWSNGLNGVFEQAIAAARQANPQALSNWQYIEFRSNAQHEERPIAGMQGIKRTLLPCDPLVLSLFHLAVI